MKAFKQKYGGAPDAVWVPSVTISNNTRRAVVEFSVFLSPAIYAEGENRLNYRVYQVTGDEFVAFLKATETKPVWDAAIDFAKARKDSGPVDDRVSFFENATVVEI